MTSTNPNDRRNPDNAGLLKREARKIGKIGTITTLFPPMTIPVEILDVKINYGKPLYLVQSLTNPEDKRWTPNVTLSQTPK